MRVLQLIDSLEAGGAERVSVNLANALSDEIEASFLCATRKEGSLKKALLPSVSYFFLNKRKTLDIKSILKLHRFVKKNKISIIHAHSTSYFLGTIIKLLNPKLKLVAHFHLGNMHKLPKKQLIPLKTAAKYFDTIICVNEKLFEWTTKNIAKSNIFCLINFAVKDNFKPETELKGIEGKRILHLANLRKEKDHFNLLKAFHELVKEDKEVSLHCVGKKFNDDYSKEVEKLCYDLKMEKNVFFYGSRKDVSNIISQSDICVLSSKSEGLPVSLIEYGLHAKPVVVTNVGDCEKVVFNKKNGIVVNIENHLELANGLRYLLNDLDNANFFGKQLKETIKKQFSKNEYINELINIYNSL